MTGLTIALATCWTARGCLHAAQLASTFSRTTTPIPARPRYRPSGLALVGAHHDVVHVPDEPGEHHHGSRDRSQKATKAHMMRKWIDRPICRLPGSFGYHVNRAVKAGDIEGPVRIASGARTNTTPK